MAYTDLRDFIQALEKHGELKRVSIEVDPVLEIAEFADRSVKSQGPALLFEKPKGSRVPVLINAFASMRRMELALEVDAVDAIAARISEYLEMRMPAGLIGKLKMLPKLAEVGSFFPRRVSDGPCKEVVRKKDFSLADYPILKCWPQDGGVTSPSRWSFRAIPTRASATAAATGCRFSTIARPGCTGRRTSRGPSTIDACRKGDR